MGNQTIIVETKNGVISTKARYIDSELLAKMQRCFRNGCTTILEIPEEDVEKYPADLFSELNKKPNIKKSKTEK